MSVYAQRIREIRQIHNLTQPQFAERIGTTKNQISKYELNKEPIPVKHVDFVICNRNMKVLFIIELNDKSHLRPDRIERDKFIKEILESTGYILIQTYAITEDILNDALNKALNKQQ